jgi:uncharacterized membrane protein
MVSSPKLSLAQTSEAMPGSALQHQTSVSTRIASVDLVRGIIMILMVLDHTRDYFHHFSQYSKPTDLAVTTTAIFFTRWITHFCAPGFVFLAGISIYLNQNRGKSAIEISNFLLLRGFLLILLEMTVVRFAWDFTARPYFYAQIIWVLGFCMVLMSFVVRPIRTIALAILLAAWLLFFPASLTSQGFFLAVFGKGIVNFSNGFYIVFNYPILPWFIVMLSGYYFGRVMTFPDSARKKITVILGGVLFIGFLALRILDICDLQWKTQATGFRSLLAFLNVTKLPPSLPFLLMTVGIILFALFVADRTKGQAAPLLLFGRVPLLFYIAHLYLIHALALIVTAARGQDFRWALPLTIWFPPPSSSDFGFGLPVTYLVSVIAILLLYPICRAFSKLKQSRRHPWMSYL